MSDDDDPVDMGDLELYEGDLSMVVRSDGEVQFIIACEDESGEDYLRCLNLVQFLKFALENDQCKRLFELSLQDSIN